MPLDNSNEDQYANPIPAGVRRSSARAEEIARQIGMANAPPAPDATPPQTGADNTPPADHTPEVTPPTTTVVQPPPAEDWEQRYRSLQGKYDAEVPALRAQVNGMERLMANLQAPAHTPTPTPTPPATTVVEIPQQDIDDFGPDLVAAARRWAMAEISPRLNELASELKELKEQATTAATTAQNARNDVTKNTMLSSLDADPQIGKVWRSVNEDPKFYDGWCKLADPFSGQTRLQLLRNAWAAGDVVRTKAFFTAYLAEHTAPEVPATPTPTPPAATQGTGRPSLEDFAAPGRGQGQTPSGAQPDKRIWSQQGITAFYRDVQKGVFQGNEPERLRLERDLFAAAAEGRIR